MSEPPPNPPAQEALAASTSRISQLHAAGRTDSGTKRKNNEDAFGVGLLTHPLLAPETSFEGTLPPAGLLLVVSDGLGGGNAGEVASRLSVDTFHAFLRSKHSAFAPLEAMRAAVSAADSEVRAASVQPGQDGMGATLSALWLRPAGGVLCHVGDSRVYRWRADKLEQLSQDHSPVGRMRQSGQLSEEDARRHPYRSMIDQSLGGDLSVFAPDVVAIDTRADDVFLLCSDGLTDGVRDADLCEALAGVSTHSPARVCDNLIKAARRGSGRDNITAVIAHVTDGISPASSFFSRLFKR